MTRGKRILFGASYSVIEPLGLLHLAGLARDEGWERKIHLVKDHNFEPFFEKVKDYKPDIVGFNVYTGNHLQLHAAFQRLKKDYPHIITVVGGPHPTYFPAESARHADYVVMSEGFGALRKILRGEENSGILPMEETERFPHPDRETFYKDYPQHAKSRIKSFISMTGCPYRCTYCYNSSEPDDIVAPPEVINKVKNGFSLNMLGKGQKKMGMGGRLFPYNVRSVDDVINEASEIVGKWPTEVLYCQDDVHGFDITEWLPELAKRWKDEVGIPYHAQMRWEMTKEEKRLDILREAGCFGLTLAIEAADYSIRKEVLDRPMPEEVMFNGMKAIIDRGFKVRTEQITGLPYGATSTPTKVNLDADLALIELNVKLREMTGGPTMAWASTLAPYKGTKLGKYCEDYGYYIGDNSDVPDTFFDRSVLGFLKEWIGPDLINRKNDANVWLASEELEEYRDRNAELRRLFNFFTLVPEGHILAEKYLKSNELFGYERLSRDTKSHLNSIGSSNSDAHCMLENIWMIESIANELTINPTEQSQIKSLAGYFGCLPKGDIAAIRFIKYGRERGEFTPRVLSDSTRHHLYEQVLYEVNGSNLTQKEYKDQLQESSRFLSKV